MKAGWSLMAAITLPLACAHCTCAADAPAQSTEEIQSLILRLEEAWAQVDVTNDRSIFEDILAPDFQGASSHDGKLLDRTQWLAEWEYESITSATSIHPVVRVVSPDLAIFNGIDETRKAGPGGVEVHQDMCTIPG